MAERSHTLQEMRMKKQPYTPDNWNPWPETTPPKGIPMRVEAQLLIGKAHYMLIWDGFCWRHPDWDNKKMDWIKKLKFRPWDN